jgi:hypothetical protein
VRLNDKNVVSIPEPIVQLQRQLDQFRSTQPHRSRIPEAGGRGAGAAAWSICGGSSTAPDYVGLERPLEGVTKLEKKKQSALPRCVELIVAHLAGTRIALLMDTKEGERSRNFTALSPSRFWDIRCQSYLTSRTRDRTARVWASCVRGTYPPHALLVGPTP